MSIVHELEEARARMLKDCHGIGEPVIRIDPKTLGIARDDHSLIFMSMTDLTKLVRAIVLDCAVTQDQR